MRFTISQNMLSGEERTIRVIQSGDAIDETEEAGRSRSATRPRAAVESNSLLFQLRDSLQKSVYRSRGVDITGNES